jgi:CelD/BcsL family acetyltransferase involved in cellulose biosynthesis
MRPPDLILAPDDDRLPIDAWDALAESSGTSYFQTGTWSVAWWDLVAGRPETRIALWNDGSGGLQAVCALSRVDQTLLRRGGPSVRVWVNTGSGAGAGDHLGWPALPEYRGAVIGWAAQSTSGPVLLSNLAPESASGLEERGFRRLDDTPTLAAPLGSGDNWFPGSSDFRKKLRYAERQLEKLGITLSMATAPEIDDALFRRLLELHATRSEGMGWGSSFDHDREAFHRRLIDEATGDRGPTACVAWKGDEVVGVLYGFRFGDTFAYYQTGWSQEFAKESLGSVLVATTMRHAAESGATRFDFLRGDDPYKRRFGALPAADQTWSLDRGIGAVSLGLRRRAVAAAKGARK